MPAGKVVAVIRQQPPPEIPVRSILTRRHLLAVLVADLGAELVELHGAHTVCRPVPVDLSDNGKTRLVIRIISPETQPHGQRRAPILEGPSEPDSRSEYIIRH